MEEFPHGKFNTHIASPHYLRARLRAPRLHHVSCQVAPHRDRWVRRSGLQYCHAVENIGVTRGGASYDRAMGSRYQAWRCSVGFAVFRLCRMSIWILLPRTY